jgi:outer membrane protein assembly factor BamE (lipoprotein component of BamABCDE complex)
MVKAKLLGILAVLLLAGCASDPASKMWSDLREESFRGLRPGVTTQAEVVKAIGSPQQKTSFERLGEETWDYRYIDGNMQMLAWVVFDSQGKFKHYVGQPDPARYSCIGG